MKARSAMGHSPLRAAQWLAAALVLSACGGGNNDGSASASGTANALRIHGQPFNPVPCAVEGGACSLVGQQSVAYGVDGKFVTRSFVSRAPCTDTAFGMTRGNRSRLCYVSLASAAPTAGSPASGSSTSSMTESPTTTVVVTTPSSGGGTSSGSTSTTDVTPVSTAPDTSTGSTSPTDTTTSTTPVAATTTDTTTAGTTTGGATTTDTTTSTAGAGTGSSAGAGTGSSAGTGTATVTHGGIAVDMSNPPVPQPGISTVLLTQTGVVPPMPAASDWEHDGAFRTVCNFSRMAFDDPIVYPGQPGVAHHHTFFGNTAIDASTTMDNIRSRGNATCRGGTINMSGYWVPSMIDTATNRPIVPKSLLVYYKTGLWTYMADGSVIQPLPKGLRMIAGDASRSTPGGVGTFSCMMPAQGYDRPGTLGSTIPACETGDELWMRVHFPQCWDGRNLDSPDHKSHMAYPEGWPQYDSQVPGRGYRCPLTHPVVLPQITFTVMFKLPAGVDTSKWRLASDTYAGPAGYSAHGDWMDGWDPAVSDLWGVECLRKRRDCGTANLGDGRTTNAFQGN